MDRSHSSQSGDNLSNIISAIIWTILDRDVYFDREKGTNSQFLPDRHAVTGGRGEIAG